MVTRAPAPPRARRRRGPAPTPCARPARTMPSRVDEEGRALDAHVLPAVHRLLDPDPEALDHRRRSRRRGAASPRPCLSRNLLVALHAVLRDADDGRVRRLELRQPGGEAERLGGAARGVVLGIEVEHQLAPGEVRRPEHRRRRRGAGVKSGTGWPASTADIGGSGLAVGPRQTPSIRRGRKGAGCGRPRRRLYRRAEGTAMRLDDFDYDLPEELIALRPARPRPASRLLVAGADSAARFDRRAPRRLARARRPPRLQRHPGDPRPPRRRSAAARTGGAGAASR